LPHVADKKAASPAKAKLTAKKFSLKAVKIFKCSPGIFLCLFYPSPLLFLRGCGYVSHYTIFLL